MHPLMARFDEHISALASYSGNQSTTPTELRLLLEIRSRITALETAGRELLAIADQVNDVAAAGRHAQSDELADRLYPLDSIVTGRSEPEQDSRTPAVDRNEPVELMAHRRERMCGGGLRCPPPSPTYS
jgi:hypothetical protein